MKCLVENEFKKNEFYKNGVGWGGVGWGDGGLERTLTLSRKIRGW